MPTYEVCLSGIITELRLDIDLTHRLTDEQREAADVYGSGGNWRTYSITKDTTPNPERTAASRAFFRLAQHGLISQEEAHRAAGFLSARPSVAERYVKEAKAEYQEPSASRPAVQAPAHTRWGYGDDNTIAYFRTYMNKNGKLVRTEDGDKDGDAPYPEDLFPADF